MTRLGYSVGVYMTIKGFRTPTVADTDNDTRAAPAPAALAAV